MSILSDLKAIIHARASPSACALEMQEAWTSFEATHPGYPENFPEDAAWLSMCLRKVAVGQRHQLSGGLPDASANLAADEAERCTIRRVLASSQAVWHIINDDPEQWLGLPESDVLSLLVDMQQSGELESSTVTTWPIIQFLCHPTVEKAPVAIDVLSFVLRSKDVFAQDDARASLRALLRPPSNPVARPRQNNTVIGRSIVLSVLPASKTDWALSLGQAISISSLPAVPSDIPPPQAAALRAALDGMEWLQTILKASSWLEVELARHELDQSTPHPSSTPARARM